MQKALLFSEAEGYLRPFINETSLIAPILKRIADEQPRVISIALLEKICAAGNIPLSGAPLSHHMYEDLTGREIEILGWIAQGLKNKEIAQIVPISINTVKYHVRSILTKLNVNTRGKAILKAKEMKIL